MLFFPSKFIPRPASKLENNLPLYAPPQFLVLGMTGLIAPGALLEYALFNGRTIIGTAGLLLWVPLLWLALIEFHNMGRIRFWLSAPAMLIVHVLVALGFAGRL